MTENLRDAVAEARERNQPLSAAELRAGWAGVEARAGEPKSVTPWIFGGAMTAIAALLIGFFAFRAPAAIQLVQEHCATVDGQRLTTSDACDARIDSDELQLSRATIVTRKAKNRLEVVQGRARFNVTRRMTESDHLEVRVRGATIIVVGTAFTVEQSGDAGKVTLEHGTIRFVWDDQEQQDLVPGESVVWPRLAPRPPEPAPAPEPEPTPEPDAPRPKHVDAKVETTVEQIMQRQFQLRAQRRYDEAIDVLKNAAADRTFTKAQRERFDYELGVLMQAHHPDQACAHWKHHRDLFGGARPDVNKALEDCP